MVPNGNVEINMDDPNNKYVSELFRRISADKRQRILDTAVEEFARNGFANANVNRIAKKAGISIGSLYKYFVTKDDLYMYVVHEASLIIQEYVREILSSDTTVMEKIERLLRAAHDYSIEEPDIIKLYGVITSDNDEERAAIVAKKLEGITSAAYRQLMAEAQQRGEVRDDISPGVLAVMVDNQLMSTQFSFANSYYNRRLMLFLGEDGRKEKNDGIDDEINVDQMIGEMLSALKNMLAPAASEAQKKSDQIRGESR